MARTPKPERGKQVAVPNNPGIYKRTLADGEVVYFARPWDPAKQVRVKLPNRPNLKEAQKDKRDFEQEKATRQRAATEETVESWARRWMTLHGAARGESTRAHYEERVQAFVRDFGDRPLSSITRAEADLWVRGGSAGDDLAAVAANWDGSTITDGIVTVKSHKSHAPSVRVLFNDARKSGLIELSPFAGLGIEKGRGRKDIQVPDLQSQDLEDLVAITRRTHGVWGRAVFAPMIVVAAHTGLRPGELFALTPADVDLNAEDAEGRWDPKLHVRRQFNSKLGKETETKNKQRREVTLLKQAHDAFERLELDTLSQHEPIFKTAKGRQFNQAALYFYWNPVRAAFAESRPKNHWLRERLRRDPRANFDFYELRHFFGTMLAELGVSPYDIAEQMGHMDGGKLAMDVYIHVRSSNARRRIRALEQARDEDGRAA